MLRVSKFNIYLDMMENDNYLIIQGVRGAFDIVEKSVVEKLEEALLEPDKLEEIPEDSKNILIRRGYITNLSEDEEFMFIQKLSKAINEKGRKHLSITMMPTYNCNFRCEYCFERNLQKNGVEWLNAKMSPDIVDAVFTQLIKKEKEGYKLDGIYLFGGEPLLQANKDIVEYICEKAYKLKIPISCISNGYDLDKYIDVVKEYKFKYIQITIDGIEEEHDKRRFLLGGQGTYDKIMKNIDLALNEGIHIVLRTNVNKKNLDGINKLIELYKANGWMDKKNFTYYFKSTMKCYDEVEDSLSDIELMTKLSEIYKEPVSRFQFNSIYHGISDKLLYMLKHNTFAPFRSGYCGANMGMYTIDPYGDIYPCWDVLAEDENVIGKVDIQRQEFVFNEKLENWKGRTVDKLKECRNCKYMLFCGGGCSAQAKVLYNDINRVFCDDFQQLFNQVAVDVCKEHIKNEVVAEN